MQLYLLQQFSLQVEILFKLLNHLWQGPKKVHLGCVHLGQIQSSIIFRGLTSCVHT